MNRNIDTTSFEAASEIDNAQASAEAIGPVDEARQAEIAALFAQNPSLDALLADAQTVYVPSEGTDGP